MWKHFSWLAFYFLEQTNKNCLFMLYRCLCRWDVRMHSAFKWGCNAFCSCRDPKTAMRDTVYISISAYSELQQQCFFCQSRQQAGCLPSHIMLIRGLGARYVKSCHGPSLVQLTLAYIGVCGQESSTVLFIFIFWDKLCQGGAWLVMR